jgi:hypothetical protein
MLFKMLGDVTLSLTRLPASRRRTTVAQGRLLAKSQAKTRTLIAHTVITVVMDGVGARLY